jgi:hypothetical protein
MKRNQYDICKKVIRWYTLAVFIASTVTRACHGKCPGEKASALVVALPEIWGHQFSRRDSGRGQPERVREAALVPYI